MWLNVVFASRIFAEQTPKIFALQRIDFIEEIFSPELFFWGSSGR